MINKLINAISNSTKEKEEEKNLKLNSDAKVINKGSSDSFGGYTENQIKNSIKNAQQNDSLSVARVGDDAKKALEAYQDKESVFKIAASSSFSEIVATIYSEGDVTGAIEKLRGYLNDNKGEVEKRFWYMLMDCYQVTGNKASFERTALAFAHAFGASPPSWQEQTEDKKSVMAGKNILILEPTFKTIHTERFKEFLKASKQEQFCRINVSQCKFEQSELAAIQALYQLFLQLRRAKVMSILMGDNNLIGFCKSYINPNIENKSLKQHFIDNEEFFWLLYLEILQWKGKHEEFEDLSFEYAKKFEISSPGWDMNGVMLYDKSHEDSHQIEKPVLDKVLNSNNIHCLLELIKSDFITEGKSEIECHNLERIDFSSAGEISYFIQGLWAEEEHKNKEIIFRGPNEMILILLEMVGVTEFIKIIPKIR
jgi:hypothetical protein